MVWHNILVVITYLSGIKTKYSIKNDKNTANMNTTSAF